MRVPLNELQFSFATASGKGGQNVNKTATKAILHWSLGRSRIFTVAQKMRLRSMLGAQLTKADELVIMIETERSQLQNRQRAVRQLHSILEKALCVPKSRRPTRPTRSSSFKRLASKKRHSLTKQKRRVIGE